MKISTTVQTWVTAFIVPLLCLWVVLDPRFLGADGFVDGSIMLPLSFAFAAGLLAWSANSSWRVSGAWLALALAGQAIALQLIDAGPRIHYQHFRVGEIFSGTVPLLTVLLAVQVLIVITGVSRSWYRITPWIQSKFRIWQLLLIGLTLILFSATLSPSITDYVSELIFAGILQLVNLANLALAVSTLPAVTLASLKKRYSVLFGRFNNDEPVIPVNTDLYALVLAVLVASLALGLNVFIYERHPHLADEVVYLYHANYFAQGMLTMPLPPVPDAFNMDLMTFEDHRWYCPVPPGWPLMLAIGSYLNVPWLINPLLAGISVLLAYALLREIFNKGLSRLILLLFALSPWQIFLAMSFMTHTFSLVATLLSALAVARMRRQKRLAWALVGGIALGVTSWIRPLEGLAIALLLGFWMLGIDGWKYKFRLIPVYILSSILVGAAVLPYNKYLTGDSMNFPIMAYNDKYYGEGSNSMGFGPEKGLGWTTFDPFPGHGLIDVLINNNLNLYQLNVELFGWSAGSLFLFAVIVFSGRMRRQDYWMLSAVLMIIGVHCFYWFSGGPDFGARYWYLTILPLVVLSVRGLVILADEHDKTDASITRLVSFGLAFSMLATINYLPWRAIDKYHHYLNMRGDIPKLVKQHNIGNDLVLIRGQRFPDYMSAAVYNAPLMKDDSTVFAWDRSLELRSHLIAAFPDRNIWLVDGPSVTKQGYILVKGPVNPEDILQEVR
ncbi:MAG: hypothetical protein OEY45_01975 [Gammaproteobacteria bacterium]|nr:hypothetical protein [Gammaproteobacteria bacterium]